MVTNHLLEQVNSRLVSDVPVGLFLSSGTDSSLIDAALRYLGRDDCLRLTAEIPQKGYTEHAAARGRSANYKALALDPAALEAAASKTLRLFDEPLADTAAIPLGLLADAAQEHVTVVLGGDGADELFGGYNRYVVGRLAHQHPLLAQALAAAGPVIASFERARGNDRGAGRLDRLSAAVTSRGEAAFAASFMSGRNWLPASLAGEASERLLTEIEAQLGGASTSLKSLCDVDTVTFLRSQLLPKTDRVLMSRSLEGRLPFLSRKTYDLARTLGDDCLVSGRQTKTVLRAVRQKLDRMTGVQSPRVAAKTGFDVPITGSLLTGLQGELEAAVTLVSKMFGRTTGQSLQAAAAGAMKHATREVPLGLSVYRAAAVGAWADEHAVT
jgi:asparagine synthase (glutamine-hydrolysing)